MYSSSMRVRLVLAVVVLLAACVRCEPTREAAGDVVDKAEPASEKAPPRPLPNTEVTRVPVLETPPVEGLEVWAEAPMTVDAFMAQATAVGIDLRHTVRVSSIPELLRALAPNTAIVLAPGRHVFEDSKILAEPEERAALPKWAELSEFYDDGELHDLHDVAIIGAGPEPTVVLQADGYAPALSLRNVKNIALHGLTLGHHPEQGWCKGGVVRVIEGENVLITDSTLFGSGTEGLSLVTVDGLRIIDSVITNSSEQFSSISQSRSISYERVRIIGNRSDLLRGFAIHHSEVSLSDCVIANNKPLSWESRNSYGLLFSIDGSYDPGQWFVDEPRPIGTGLSQSEVTLRNTMIDGQRFDQRL